MISRKPIVKFLFLGVVLAYMILGIEYAIAEETLAGFVVDFMDEKTLSEEEIETVAKLAYLAGIGEISLITTANLPPSGSYGIQVREKSIADGPYLKYRVLFVGNEKFYSEDYQVISRERSESMGGATIGGFWELDIRTYKFLLEEIDGEAVEIGVGEGVDYNDLMFILNSISNDQVKYYPGGVSSGKFPPIRQLPSYVGLKQTVTPGLGTAEYVLIYGRSRSSSTFRYYVYLEEDGVVVLGMGHSVS